MIDMISHIHVAPVPSHIPPFHICPPPHRPISGIMSAIRRNDNKKIAATTIKSVRTSESLVAMSTTTLTPVLKLWGQSLW